ncbi:MAG: DUF1572 family protein [Saprospiraceae bacterium]|nr:DUF1572 family protein [Saprospiraceae bacterium]
MNPLITLIQKEFNLRIIQESKARILSCLELLDDHQLQWKPNPQTNSIQILVVHLCGNLRQYICAAIGQQNDVRDRNSEFNTEKVFSKMELQSILNSTTEDAWSVIQTISEQRLLDNYEVQCFNLSGYEIVSHVIEHFSYHTGQIALLTKIITQKDLGFYKDLDLN